MTADPVVVIGAGPAGLTAALRLVEAGTPVVVLEATDTVGGISQTVERDGWRFDIGGHRFFTKVPEVEQFWHEVLDDDEFLQRPRMSRILYDGKLFDYPLKPLNALRQLGPVEALRCLLSYAWVRVRPPRDTSNFEGWVAARFGWRLYRMFFKTYTEKVWGIPATQIQADWAAQRIKNLSLLSAVVNAFRPQRGDRQITTLIDRFQYPKLGPGMMWERVRDLVEQRGGVLRMRTRAAAVERDERGATAVIAERDGERERIACRAVISSMPFAQLGKAVEPTPPEFVRRAAGSLRFRDFLTVALVVPESAGFPDNWIYIHTPGVRVGRVQNFRSWSPAMVKTGRTCLGLEYFVNEGDEMWSKPDEELVALARDELQQIGIADTSDVECGYVVRIPKAYPVYDEGYDQRVDTVRRWISEHLPNVHPVGRNGMHKYNNQDHSMLTAMLAADNVLGADHDVWSVNVEEDYHEGGDSSGERTGRAAPVVPLANSQSAA